MTFREPGKRVKVEPMPKEAPAQPEPRREPAQPDRAPEKMPEKV